MTRFSPQARIAADARISLLLFAVVLLSACAPAQAPIPLLPEGARLPPGDARTEHVLRDYHAATQARRALRGSARVALEGPDFRLDRPQRIAIERPGRLRFEILALFDQIAAILTTDGERYGFFDASTGEVRRGRVSPSLLWDLTRIDLDPQEVVTLLLAAPEPSLGTAHAGTWLEPSGRLAVAFAWPDAALEGACDGEDRWDAFFAADCALGEGALFETGGQLFFFGPEGRLVELRAIDPGGAIRYRAHFENFEWVPDPAVDDEAGVGVTFPKRVTLESPNTGSSARFVWKRVMLADELSDRLFQIPAPRGDGG